MFEQLDIFRMSSAMAVHAGRRQAIIAQNVANADTPAYVARDVGAFKTSYRPDDGAGMLRTTRPGHLAAFAADGGQSRPFMVTDEASPNGNAVSLETEMMKSLDTKREHDRALAIYKSALNVLRTTIGR
jgi:flagellar basal-body rod protein FlgB